MEEKTIQPVEERVLAALSHGAVIAQGTGIAAGLLVYITQRGKSKYAAFQGLQAAVYQIVTLILTIVIWVVWGILYALSFIPLVGLTENEAPPMIFWIAMASMIVPMIIMLIMWGYGLIGALKTWRGEDFHYVLIGQWLEKSSLNADVE